MSGDLVRAPAPAGDAGDSSPAPLPVPAGHHKPLSAEDERVRGLVRRGSLLGQFAIAVALVLTAVSMVVAGVFVFSQPLLAAAPATVMLNRALSILRHLEDPAAAAAAAPTATSVLAAMALRRTRRNEPSAEES